MEIILELFLEFFGQILFEAVADFGFRGLARALSNAAVRVVLGVTLAVAVGFGCGFWWGDRLTAAGRTEPPRSLWISIGLAVAFTALAVRALARDRARAVAAEPAYAEPAPAWLPWHWSPLHALCYAVLNAAAAVGIAAGFSPQPLG